MTIRCNDWDSDKPEILTEDGRVLGVLRPQISREVLAASTDIQSWSQPDGALGVRMYEPASVASFAEHWERVYRETYPLAEENSDA